jgi:hypothetical protein
MRTACAYISVRACVHARVCMHPVIESKSSSYVSEIGCDVRLAPRSSEIGCDTSGAADRDLSAVADPVIESKSSSYTSEIGCDARLAARSSEIGCDARLAPRSDCTCASVCVHACVHACAHACVHAASGPPKPASVPQIATCRHKLKRFKNKNMYNATMDRWWATCRPQPTQSSSRSPRRRLPISAATCGSTATRHPPRLQ